MPSLLIQRKKHIKHAFVDLLRRKAILQKLDQHVNASFLYEKQLYFIACGFQNLNNAVESPHHRGHLAGEVDG